MLLVRYSIFMKFCFGNRGVLRVSFDMCFTQITTKNIGAIALCLTALIGQEAIAASFDCANARLPMEVMICSDAQLNQQDADMGKQFKVLKALHSDQNYKDLLHEQKNWLKDRDSTCNIPTQNIAAEQSSNIINCLKNIYANRISVLNDDMAQAAITVKSEKAAALGKAEKLAAFKEKQESSEPVPSVTTDITPVAKTQYTQGMTAIPIQAPPSQPVESEKSYFPFIINYDGDGNLLRYQLLEGATSGSSVSLCLRRARSWLEEKSREHAEVTLIGENVFSDKYHLNYLIIRCATDDKAFKDIPLNTKNLNDSKIISN